MIMVELLQQTLEVAWPGLLLALAGAIMIPTVRHLIIPGRDPEDHQRWLAVSVMHGFGPVLIFAGTIYAGYQALTYQVDVLTDGELARLLIGLAMAPPATLIGLVVGSVISQLWLNQRTRP